MEFLKTFLHVAALASLPALAHGQTDYSDLLQVLDQRRSDAGVAGLGLVLVNREEMLFCGGLGVADRASGRPFDPRTVVRIGSISKSFTGLGLLAAVERGLVDLDTPIDAYLDPPPLENPFSAAVPTLAMLMEHTAGLGDMSPKEWDHNEPISLAAALQVDPASRRLRWAPGLHSVYSNSGAGVAAHTFEQHTGKDFERWVDEVIFEPLGMANATFRMDQTDLDRLATGYNTDGASVIKYWHQLYRPFGAINVELCEMGMYLRLFLNRGTTNGQAILSAASIARAETPTTPLTARAGLRHGYGLGVYGYFRNGHQWFGHGGDADGYLSFFGYSAELEAGYFIVINAFQGRTLSAMKPIIEQHLIGGRKAAFQSPTPQPSARLAALTGRYLEAARRFGEPGSAEVIMRDGRLHMSRGNSEDVLLPMGNDTFRRRWEPIATIAFIEHAGKLYLQGPMGSFVRASR